MPGWAVQFQADLGASNASADALVELMHLSQYDSPPLANLPSEMACLPSVESETRHMMPRKTLVHWSAFCFSAADAPGFCMQGMLAK